MFLKEPVRAYVKSTNFALGFPCGDVRLEMDITMEEKTGEKWTIPFLIEDDNWIFNENNNMSYKIEDSKYQDEKSKYTMLKGIYDEQSLQSYEPDEQKKEQIKRDVFALCEGEIVYRRSVVEENMFKFLSQDFNELPEKEQNNVLEYFG